jgi:hypothetical protein
MHPFVQGCPRLWLGLSTVSTGWGLSRMRQTYRRITQTQIHCRCLKKDNMLELLLNLTNPVRDLIFAAVANFSFFVKRQHQLGCVQQVEETPKNGTRRASKAGEGYKLSLIKSPFVAFITIRYSFFRQRRRPLFHFYCYPLCSIRLPL